MRILILLVSFILFFFILGGLFAVLYATTRRDRTELFKPSTAAPSGRLKFKSEVENGIRWIDAQKKEEWCIRSQDGLNLKAFFISPADPKGAVIAMHGFRSWPEREFAGIAKLLYDNGYAVLYPFQRSHRISEGHFITFGVRERIDCKQWTELFSSKYPSLPICLYGQSMGGATVLMASGLSLPDTVKSIIADSAFGTPAEMIKFLIDNTYHIPSVPLIFFINFWTNLLAGYGLFRCTAKTSMKECYKYLFIHGTDDMLVPFSMGKDNYNSCPSQRKTFLEIQGSGHCACMYQNRSAYEAAILDTLNSSLA